MGFDERAIASLRGYVYEREGSSVTEVYFNRFWEFCIECFPRNVAPNMITLIGLVVNFLPFLIILVFSEFGEQVPSGIHLLSAVSIFIYQTLDAIDGKQARRLNLSSPLGELFDHGCDSLSTFLLVILVAAASNSLWSPALYYAVFFGMLSFYLTQWYTYVTGRLFFTSINVTESQLAAIILCLTTYLYGQQIYDYQIYGSPLSDWIINFITLSFIIMCNVMTFKLVVQILRGTATFSTYQCVVPVIPSFLLMFFGLFSVSYMDDVVEIDRFSFLIIFSTSFSMLTVNILAAKATKTPLKPINSSLIFPTVYLLNIWLNIVSLNWFPLILAVSSFVSWIIEFAIICIDFSLILGVPILFL